MCLSLLYWGGRSLLFGEWPSSLPVVVYYGAKYYYRVHSESGQVLYTTALLQLNQVSVCTMISSQ